MSRPDDEMTQLIRENEPLVRTLARRHSHQGIPLEDLLQEGRLGLVRAIETFEAGRGTQFETWAWLWINDAIERAIWRETRSTGLSHREYRLLQRMRVAKRKLTQELEREPSVTELATTMGLSDARVEDLLSISLSQVPVPLDELDVGRLPYKGVPLCIAPSQAEALEKGEQAERFGTAISHLSSRQQLILTKHRGLGLEKEHTLKEIALELGISAPRVNQIEKAAMRKLKHELSHFSQPSPIS